MFGIIDCNDDTFSVGLNMQKCRLYILYYKNQDEIFTMFVLQVVLSKIMW